MMIISMIAAAGENGELGYQNKLLWDIKEDMKWFRRNTMNKPVVMGRLTYESIGKPLKGRINVVLSREQGYKPHEDVIVLPSVEAVLSYLKGEREIMVMGGGTIYQQFLPYTSRLYLTEVHKEFQADTFFPEFNKAYWGCRFSKEGSEDVGFKYTFNVYKKKI